MSESVSQASLLQYKEEQRKEKKEKIRKKNKQVEKTSKQANKQMGRKEIEAKKKVNKENKHKLTFLIIKHNHNN